MAVEHATMEEYQVATVGKLGAAGEAAKLHTENQDVIVKNLTNVRESISGVNLDEEMVQMVTLQQGYAAAARFISHVAEMLDIIINRMGV
jgi:flagellar hook-associated protein 1 FlgK